MILKRKEKNLIIILLAAAAAALVFAFVVLNDWDFPYLDGIAVKQSAEKSKKHQKVSGDIMRKKDMTNDLDSREMVLEERELIVREQKKYLGCLQDDLYRKEQNLKSLRSEIEDMVENIEEGWTANARKLARIYESMPPNQIAVIMDELRDETIASILSEMQPRAVGKVLGYYATRAAGEGEKKAYARRAAHLTDLINRYCFETADRRP